MEIRDWLPSLIAAGSLGFIWFLIRMDLKSMKVSLKEDLTKVWQEVATIKDSYLEEDKHRLICGKSALEIERLFKECLNRHKDEIFEKLRGLEKKLNK